MMPKYCRFNKRQGIRKAGIPVYSSPGKAGGLDSGGFVPPRAMGTRALPDIELPRTITACKAVQDSPLRDSQDQPPARDHPHRCKVQRKFSLEATS